MKQEKDFEDLLNDFIIDEEDDFGWESYRDEESACGLMPELKPFVSKGVTYQIPVACEAAFRFQELTLIAKTGLLNSESASSSLILWDDSITEDALLIDIENLWQAEEGVYSSDVVSILLYRVGTPEPLKIYSKHAGDAVYTVSADFSDINGKWTPGEYFLLVVNASVRENESLPNWDTMNSHSRFSFRLLAHGKTLEHPSITEISLSPDKKWTVRMDGNTSNMDEFRFLMYDEDWLDVTESQVVTPYRNVLKVPFKSYSPWLDGDYKVVMIHNEEPCTLISVSWKGNKMENCSWMPLSMDSPYYILSKYMADDMYWKRLCKIPGCRSIRHSLVGKFWYKVLNDWRDKKEMPNFINPIHLSVAVADGLYDAELANSMVNILNPGWDLRVKNCEVLLESKNAVDPYEDMREALGYCSNETLCLHHLSALNMSANGKVFLHMLEETLRETPNMALMLMGTRSEIAQVFENSPFISRLISSENRFHTEQYSVREQLVFLENCCLESGIQLAPDAACKIMDMIISNWGIMSTWRKEDLTNWLQKEIYPRYLKRLFMAGEALAFEGPSCHLMPQDICLPTEMKMKDDFSDSVCELNEMVGLENLKQSMITLFNRTRFDKMRREAGLPILDKGGYHMIFTGNPGTGKTTVAKLIGRVFHSLGLLSKGGVIVTERSKLVGRFLGETEKNMTAVLEQSKGNVLFIDEAYSLCDNNQGDRKDFGCRVLECLLTVLAQKNPDMIVILAGYEKEMNQMLEMNPGMKGRFPYQFNFEDYNAEELFQIANALLSKSEYVLTPEAELRLREAIEETVRCKDAFFHNARWVEQFILDGVISAMSDRLMFSPLCLQSRETLQTVEVQDIERAYYKMKPKPNLATAPRKRIGFVA